MSNSRIKKSVKNSSHLIAATSENYCHDVMSKHLHAMQSAARIEVFSTYGEVAVLLQPKVK